MVLVLTPAAAMAETVNITVNGLVCSFCATAIEKTFGKKGVDNIDVNLSEKYVRFDLPETVNLTDEEITQAINDAGYDVVEIDRGE